MQIYHLKHQDINKTRWDHAITAAINGNLYAYSWYLDAVSPGWEALVNLDYSVIMPLTGNRKFGFQYLSRPLLSQQLGVFSADLPEPNVVLACIQAIPKRFKLIEITLNKYNQVQPDGFSHSLHHTYELDLVQSYPDLEKKFAKNTARNIAKWRSHQLKIEPMIGVDDFSNLLWKDDSRGSEILKHPKNFPQFSHLLAVLLEKKSGLLYGCYNSEDQLISACLFGISHRKLYYLAPVNSPEGRDKRGLFGIIATLIQSFSGQPLILDFEGSDLPGLARMYAGFGALETHYAFIRRNQLPWPVSAFKRH